MGVWISFERVGLDGDGVREGWSGLSAAEDGCMI